MKNRHGGMRHIISEQSTRHDDFRYVILHERTATLFTFATTSAVSRKSAHRPDHPGDGVPVDAATDTVRACHEVKIMNIPLAMHS